VGIAEAITAVCSYSKLSKFNKNGALLEQLLKTSRFTTVDTANFTQVTSYN